MVRWIARLRPLVGLPCAIAAQQLDLQVVQRIEIREAVADAARERRVVREQRRLRRVIAKHVAHACARARRAMRAKIALAHARRRARARRSATRSRDRSWPAPSPCSTARCGRTASASCISRSSAQARPASSREPRLDRRAEAVPARQHQPALPPAEHPRNRAQVLDARRRRARRRPAADVELGDLGDRRRGAEIRDEVRRLVHQRAIRARCACAASSSMRLVISAAARRRALPRRARLASMRRGDQRLEIAPAELRIGILAGDDLALLGDAQRRR